jgi:flagellar basal-body rod modification protein FlgD
MIDPVSSAALGPSAQAAASSSPSTNRTSGISADFETFLRMLTVQAQNQDPLNPIDSNEYAAQLAQFSMVEQQVQTNDLLAASSRSGGGQLFSMAGWVGLEARASRPAVFDGTAIDVAVAPVRGADAADLVVRDSLGTIVDRQSLALDATRVLWDGIDESGAVLARGRYSFEVESRSGEATIATDPAEIYGRIVEAEMRNGSIALIFEDGETAISDNVTSLRQPL